MKLLFFDCETNGLPKDYKASYTDLNNWPRVTSIAWILAAETGEMFACDHFLIRPDGWEIPKEKFWIDQGFSTERSLQEGTPIGHVLELFTAAKMRADVLVAHNLNFDHRIVWAEIIRSGRQPRSGMAKICTMISSTSYCRLPQPNGRKGIKWPSLAELYQKLFDQPFEGAHDAKADIMATAKCFYELVRLGVIRMPVIERQEA